MRRYSSIMVLTGAGISAESGIQTFRGGGGLWEGHDIEEVATFEAYVRDPRKVLSFYNDRRRELRRAGIEPNAAHLALAEFERELIRARTGEGRERAKKEGRKMGRPHKLTPHQQREARDRHDQGESLSSIARSYNVHHATIGRLCG